MKKLLSFFIIATVILSTTACGGNSADAGKTTEPAQATNTNNTDNAQTSEGSDLGGVIKFTFRDDGQGKDNSLWRWMERAYETYPNKDKVELKVEPITASEGDYFAKIALALKSSDTAPDLVAEDTFMLGSDASAGYLEPLDDRLSKWSDWTDGKFIPSLVKGVTASDGKIYGVPYNTDTRGLWYNKEVFKQAGLPEKWEPKNWNDILDACKVIKEKVPNVVPIWFNSGKASGEATSMQTYEMLLYGTGERLIDPETNKWIVKSDNILKSLTFIDTVYKEGYGPPLSKVLTGQSPNISTREYFPQNKLGILLDGSWITFNYKENGPSPWAEYKDILEFVPMPTSEGQELGSITLAGGWALSIPANSKNKDAAFDFLTHVMSKEPALSMIMDSGSITSRSDVAEEAEYANQPFMSNGTDFLSAADFRPSHDQYPAVSTQIQAMVESVVSGTSPEEAMKKYAIDVSRVVGEDNVIEK